MKLSSRIGGHILQGHIEAVATIIKKESIGESCMLTILIDSCCHKYCIDKGSIALDGISLTIAKIDNNNISIAIIPHTMHMTTLGFKEIGDTLNVELDVIAKYIENLLLYKNKLSSKEINNKLKNKEVSGLLNEL